MILNQSILYYLLEKGGDEVEREIENQFNFYRQFDKDIDAWLHEMHYFGGYGEYYEMVERFNQKLFN